MPKNRVCATDTGLPEFTRRAFVRATAAIPLAVVPVATMAEAQADPIVPLCQQWLAARNEWIHLSEIPGNEDWKRPESVAAEQREFAAFHKMLEMTPVTNEGIAALAHVHWAMFGPASIEGSVSFKKECNRSENKIMAAIWRGASGKGGLPV
ncbi:MAG: hypothetical protein COC12_08550 [Rhodobacteraceae bacterium]|nr:MAG: hypothetical protein COC12_08550 [Paracoccaceae bacterium]